MNRNHFGNAYVYVRSKFKRKKYGGEYKVMDLWIMPSNCVQIVVDDEGYFGGRGKIWYVYNDKYSGQQYVFGTDEVLHFKTSHSLDGITGLPVQAILKTTVEGAAASQDYLNSLYESGLTGKAVVRGVLVHTQNLIIISFVLICHIVSPLCQVFRQAKRGGLLRPMADASELRPLRSLRRPRRRRPACCRPADRSCRNRRRNLRSDRPAAQRSYRASRRRHRTLSEPRRSLP